MRVKNVEIVRARKPHTLASATVSVTDDSGDWLELSDYRIILSRRAGGQVWVGSPSYPLHDRDERGNWQYADSVRASGRLQTEIEEAVLRAFRQSPYRVEAGPGERLLVTTSTAEGS